MENALTIRDNPTEIANIIETSNNMHLSVLEAIGLPTENIFLSSIDERKVAIRNLPYVIEKMNTPLLSDAYYLSKFFVAVATGLFDAALKLSMG